MKVYDKEFLNKKVTYYIPLSILFANILSVVDNKYFFIIKIFVFIIILVIGLYFSYLYSKIIGQGKSPWYKFKYCYVWITMWLAFLLAKYYGLISIIMLIIYCVVQFRIYKENKNNKKIPQ